MPPPCDTYLYSQNRAAAYYDVAIVQHYGLAAGDGALGLIEFHFHLAVRQRAHGGGLLGLAVAGLGLYPHGGGQFGDRDPVEVPGYQRGGEQFALRADGDGVFLHVLITDVNRRAQRQPQPLALAVGVAHRAVVAAHHLAGKICRCIVP